MEASDVSPAMIDRARARFGEPPGLRWVVRGFQQPVEPAEPFDAAVCVGNSLALAADREILQQALGQMLAAVRAGGVVLVQVLNLWRLPDGPCVWQKCRNVQLPRGEVLIVKGVHRCGRRGYVELIVAGPPRAGKCIPTRCLFWGWKRSSWRIYSVRPVRPKCGFSGTTRTSPTIARAAPTY